MIMDILNSDAKAIQQRPSSTTSLSGGRKKKKSTAKFLLRPIVAICNDPYVSALRSLRPLAEIISYKRPPVSAVVTRLREICAAEKLSVDTSTLKKLVDNMDGDVRGCINTLQFDMGGSRVGKQSIGQKDISANPNAIIGHIFKQRNDKKTVTERLKGVIDDVERNGEFDKITTGCFTLYPGMQYADNMLSKPVAAGDWLHFYDTLSHSIYHNQNRDLHQYLPYTAGAFHTMFSNSMNDVKEFAIPKTDFEAYEQQRSNRDLIKQLIAHAPATTSRMFRQESVIATELAPFLMTIVNPVLNPVNAGLILDREKQKLSHTIEIMIDFDFQYLQQRTDSGVYVYKADPPIEMIAKFSEQEQGSASVGKYLIRQLISQALEQEFARRLTRPKSLADSVKRKGGSDDDDGARENEEQSEDIQHRDKRVASDNLLSSSPVKVADVKPIRPSFASFFPRSTGSDMENGGGRPHSRQNSMQETKEKSKLERENRVWVQFHDGFSNAVKKPLQWNDFWRDL